MFSRAVETFLHQICTGNQIWTATISQGGCSGGFLLWEEDRIRQGPFAPWHPIVLPFRRASACASAIPAIKKLQVLFEARSGFGSACQEPGPPLGVFFSSCALASGTLAEASERKAPPYAIVEQLMGWL